MRPHCAIKGQTLAMAGGLTNAPMTMADLLKQMDIAEATAKMGINSN